MNDAAPSAPPGMATAIVHLIRRAQQQVTTSWAATITTGLTTPEFAILRMLSGGNAFDQRTIGEQLDLDKSTCGHLIDRLNRAGLLDAAIDPANRRRKLITITEAGRQRAAATFVEALQAEEAMFARLSTSERTQLTHLLARMTGLDARHDS